MWVPLVTLIMVCMIIFCLTFQGKTSLTAAITKVLSEKSATTQYRSYESIDKSPEERQRG
mgnify:CR=1 FL=1